MTDMEGDEVEIQDDLFRLTVVQLKEELRGLNLSTSGKKADLVNRLTQARINSTLNGKKNNVISQLKEIPNKILNFIKSSPRKYWNFAISEPFSQPAPYSLIGSVFSRFSLASWRIFWVFALLSILVILLSVGLIEFSGSDEESTLYLVLQIPSSVVLVIASISCFSLLFFGILLLAWEFLVMIPYNVFVVEPLKNIRKNKEARKEGYRNHADKMQQQEKKEKLREQKRERRLRAKRKAEVRAMTGKRAKLREMAKDTFSNLNSISIDDGEEKLKITYTVNGVQLKLGYSDIFNRSDKSIKDEMLIDLSNGPNNARRKVRAARRRRRTTCMRCGVRPSSPSSPRYYGGVKVCSTCNRGMQDEW